MYKKKKPIILMLNLVMSLMIVIPVNAQTTEFTKKFNSDEQKIIKEYKDALPNENTLKGYRNTYYTLMDSLQKNKSTYSKEYIDSYTKALNEKYLINKILIPADEVIINNINDAKNSIEPMYNDFLKQQKITTQTITANISTNYPNSYGSNNYSTYNRMNAKAYIDRWWNDKNPAFLFFSKGDCCNFASQVVNAGGVSQDNPNWYMQPSIYNTINYSTSWINNISFNDYFRGKEYYFCSAKGSDIVNNLSYYYNLLWAGDIIQIGGTADNNSPWHAYEVSGFSVGDVIMSAHTDPYNNRSLLTQAQAWPNNYWNFYCIKSGY